MTSQASLVSFAIFQGDRHQALVRELICRYAWTRDRAERAVVQYQQFLQLAAVYKGIPLIPTCEIDRVWEADILRNTWQYMRTCHQLCGKMIHHAGEADIRERLKEQAPEQAFAQTQTLLQQHFQQPVISPLAQQTSVQWQAESSLSRHKAIADEQQAACGVLVIPTSESLPPTAGTRLAI